jgi:superfamily I DNA and/or RNA helicase
MLCAVHAVLEANKDGISNHRVLVCTPSHTAADVVTRRLGKFLSRNQLFRLYDADRPIETVPVDVLGFCRQSDDQIGEFILPDIQILMQFQVIVCTCSDAHLLYRIGLTNQQLRVRRQCYETYIRKCCEGINLDVAITGVNEPHFTHLFIDEAAQATEPETLVPLSVVVDPDGSHRKVELALVGDPRQLSPSVYSPKAARAGLGRSWMERLLQRPVNCLGGGNNDMLGPDFAKIEDWLHYSLLSDGQDQLSFFLTLNYRGHPSFLMIPSALFYADKLNCVGHHRENDQGETFWCAKIRHIENLSNPVILQNDDSIPSSDEPDEVKCRKQFGWPLHFRGVIGKDSSVTVDSGFASTSWENLSEAKTIVEICVTLSEQRVLPKSIGVMAPFRGQVVLIRKLLRSKNLGGINVGTIEDYQSVEFDIILLSLVRSTKSFVEHDITHRMGVFGQPKRSNVALTRAEFLFVVVRLYRFVMLRSRSLIFLLNTCNGCNLPIDKSIQ